MRVPLWGWRGIPSPKCDTNPLTSPEHPCYYLSQFEHHPNYLKEEPKTQGSPPDPPEDSTPQPIPTAHTRGPRHKRPAPSPHPTGPVPLSLVVRRWKDALDRAITDRPSPAETPSRRPVSSELTLYQARGGGPAIPGRDYLSEVGPPASLRHIKQGAVGPPGPSGGPRK